MNTIHYGIMRAPNGATLTHMVDGFSSDGDSFIEWGETIDQTHHFTTKTDFEPESDGIYDTLDRKALRATIALERRALKEALAPGARLIDYVIITDEKDWSEKSFTWLLDESIG